MSYQNNSVFRIPPYHFMHVLDLNENVTRLMIGPKTFVKQDNEKVVLGPEKMITIPPRNYCVIENPAVKDKENNIQFDENGQVKLAFAELEIRFAREPFPLYPGEILKQNITPLRVLPANSALRLRAILDFEEENGEKRVAGDEWLFEGPGTYIPRKEVSVEEQIRATTIKSNQAIRLRAKKECTDRNGKERVTGEEWVIKKTGAYLPGAYEEVVSLVDAYVLTEKRALHMTSLRTFTDDFGKKRLNGEEWLITLDDTETYIPSVYENVVGVVDVTILSSRQYAVILDPIGGDGKPQLGKKRLVKGEKSFFLQPGERLEKGIQDVFVLGDDEGLILKCIEAFEDENKQQRSPGDRWMIKGPTDYVPPVEVEVVDRRKALPLDENEVKKSSSELIAGITSSISIGTSVATAYTNDNEYRIRVIIELENWSYWILQSPEVHIDAGVLSTPPSNILPLRKEAMSARKTAEVAAGSCGTVSWLVGSLNKRIVLMWSAPFNFNFYSNWMGLGITKEDVHHKSWFKNMYNIEMIPELKIYKIEEYYYGSKEIIVEDEDFELRGTMGTSHHPTIKLYLKPKNKSNMPEKIRNYFE